MNRTLFLVAACVIALPTAASAQEPTRRPNILILLSDDQRPDTIGALGNPAIRTPNLDRLVKRGHAFTRAYVTVPVCTPTRAEILTGACAMKNGVRFFGQALRPEFVQLQQLLARAGYLTWFTGKWHNDGTPEKHGFQVAKRVFKGGMGPHEKVFVEGNKKVEGFSSELFASAAADFIDSRPKEPWFMWVAFTAPHDPRTPPRKYRDMYPPDKVRLPPNYMPEHPFDNGEMVVRDELLETWPRTQDAVRKHLAEYYGMISHLDEQVGRILEALERTGQLENTIVVFLSDNGLAIGSHGLFGKQNMYDHSVRVPLILAGPGIPQGKRSDALCYNYDLYPTLCELVGVKAPATVDGKSLVPILQGKQTKVRDYVCSAYQNVQRMVRTDRWKLIVYPQIGQWQLFDMKNDPHELVDLLQPWRGKKVGAFRPPLEAEKASAVANDLMRKLQEWQREVGDTLPLRAQAASLGRSQHEAGVAAAEAERVRHRHPHPPFLCDVRDVQQPAVGVGVLEVDRRGDGVAVQRDDARQRLDGGRGGQQVAGHALR